MAKNSLIGEQSKEPCPQCNKPLYKNKRGDIWCICGYSPDPELEQFGKQLKRYVAFKQSQ